MMNMRNSEKGELEMKWRSWSRARVLQSGFLLLGVMGLGSACVRDGTLDFGKGATEKETPAVDTSEHERDDPIQWVGVKPSGPACEILRSPERGQTYDTRDFINYPLAFSIPLGEQVNFDGEGVNPGLPFAGLTFRQILSRPAGQLLARVPEKVLKLFPDLQSWIEKMNQEVGDVVIKKVLVLGSVVVDTSFAEMGRGVHDCQTLSAGLANQRNVRRCKIAMKMPRHNFTIILLIEAPKQGLYSKWGSSPELIASLAPDAKTGRAPTLEEVQAAAQKAMSTGKVPHITFSTKPFMKFVNSDSLCQLNAEQVFFNETRVGCHNLTPGDNVASASLDHGMGVAVAQAFSALLSASASFDYYPSELAQKRKPNGVMARFGRWVTNRTASALEKRGVSAVRDSEANQNMGSPIRADADSFQDVKEDIQVVFADAVTGSLRSFLQCGTAPVRQVFDMTDF